MISRDDGTRTRCAVIAASPQLVGVSGWMGVGVRGTQPAITHREMTDFLEKDTPDH